MAEFCFESFIKYFDEKAEKSDLVISKDLDLCEGCAEYKRVVVCYRKSTSLFHRLIGLFRK